MSSAGDQHGAIPVGDVFSPHPRSEVVSGVISLGSQSSKKSLGPGDRDPEGTRWQEGAACSAKGTGQGRQDGEKLSGGRCVCERRVCLKGH